MFFLLCISLVMPFIANFTLMIFENPIKKIKILKKAFPLLCPLTPAISAYIIGRFQCHEDLAIRKHQENQQTLEKEHLMEIKKYESDIKNWARYFIILKELKKILPFILSYLVKFSSSWERSLNFLKVGT